MNASTTIEKKPAAKATPEASAPAQTYQDLFEAVMIDISDRENRVKAEDKEHHAEINRLRGLAIQCASVNDTEGSLRASAQASALQRQVIDNRQRLNDLGLERLNAQCGSHPRLAGLSGLVHARREEGDRSEYKAAVAAFQQLLTPELRAAAQRVIDASKVHLLRAPDAAFAIINA